jgi:hypothetical protein
VLVNMPAILVRDGMAAFTFGNGLPEQLRLVFDDRVRFPLLVHTYSTGVNGAFAGGSGEIPFSRLGSLIQEPRNLVLRFDFGSRRVVADERTARTIPRDYLRDTSPLLEWQEGQWPWLRVAAGSPLELPLAPPPEGAWIALRYLHGPETSFTVTEGAGATSALAIAANRRPADWPVALFPAPSASGAAEPLTLRLSPRSEVWLAGLWTFAPPRDYTPEAAPFLGWSFRPFAAFTLTDAIRLPLAAPSSSASPATIRLEVLAEPGRNFSLALEGGPRRASTSPPWPPGSGTRSTSRRLRASRRSSASSPRGRGQSS